MMLKIEIYENLPDGGRRRVWKTTNVKNVAKVSNDALDSGHKVGRILNERMYNKIYKKD